jgi:hypothetical protein
VLIYMAIMASKVARMERELTTLDDLANHRDS